MRKVIFIFLSSFLLILTVCLEANAASFEGESNSIFISQSVETISTKDNITHVLINQNQPVFS